MFKSDIQHFTSLKHTLVFLFSGLLTALGSSPLWAQPETDVYLSRLTLENGMIMVGTPENISRNPGYDNQPSFMDSDHLLYARTRMGQTDIAKYSIEGARLSWLSDTPGGSEYSPLKIPEKQAISAIRLDTTGLQRLYSYALEGGSPSLLVDNLKIGYHLWYSPEVLVCTVLVDDRMDLVVVNFSDNSHYTFQKNVGRSLHRIPDSDRISFTGMEEGKLWVKAMDPVSGATEPIVELPAGVQDICWLDPERILCGKGPELWVFETNSKGAWTSFFTLENSKSRITRLTFEPSTSMLALVIGQE